MDIYMDTLMYKHNQMHVNVPRNHDDYQIIQALISITSKDL